MQSSSRLVCGNDKSYQELEKILAKQKYKQGALVFPTGYMANLGVIAALAKKGDTILSDELNHASIIEACKISDATVSVYGHNDTDDLRKKIRHAKGKRFIITEGIFSMDGDLAKLDEISEIAQKNNAITILDDAHGDFVMGKDGRGTAHHYNVAKKIDVHTSSLSKGLGSFGGYIASEDNVIDYCINKSKSFIYTSALPSVFINHALKRIKTNLKPYQKRLEKNTSYMIKGLNQSGYQVNSQSQIIPIIIGNEKTATNFGKYLIDKGIFAQPIRYPTVAKNRARIRISVTAWLKEPHIQKSLDVFDRAGKKFGII